MKIWDLFCDIQYVATHDFVVVMSSAAARLLSAVRVRTASAITGWYFSERATFLTATLFFLIRATWRSKYNYYYLLKPTKPILTVILSDITLLAGNDPFND